jgi:hypothetical protein
MMRIKEYRGAVWKVAGLAAMFIATLGCDLTGQYDKKFQQALVEAGRKSMFDALLHRDFTEIVDSARQPIGVKLRLPKQFDAESKALAQTVIRRLTDIPGATYSLMKEVDDDSGQKAMCTVQMTVVPKAEQKPEAVQSLVAKLATDIAAGSKWEDVSLGSPSGQQQTLKRIRIETQTAVATAKGPGKTVPDRIDVYQIDGGNNTVIIAWETPKPHAQKHNLERAIEASMGTVEVAAAAGGNAAGAAGGKASGCF